MLSFVRSGWIWEYAAHTLEDHDCVEKKVIVINNLWGEDMIKEYLLRPGIGEERKFGLFKCQWCTW